MIAQKIEPRYESHGDAHTRLQGCVLMYRGYPVSLWATGDSFMFNPKPLDKRDIPAEILDKWPERINVSTDPDLNLCVPPLGYVNDKFKEVWEPLFISRLSVRRYQQGLNARNIAVVRERNPTERAGPAPGRDYGASNAALSKTLLNKYPSWKEAWETAHSKTHYGMAFNRCFCLAKTEDQPEIIRLRYMTKTFGLIDPDRRDPVVHVLPEFQKHGFLLREIANHGVRFE